MIVLDASMPIAQLGAADAHHAAAGALPEASSDARLIVHPITLAEVLVGVRGSAAARRC